VALMGGAIRVESAPGEGALFLVDVPFRPAEDAIEEPTPAAREQSATHGALRILLAEDNLINQRLALRVLEKAGHSVMVAANGCEAVDLAARQQFDIALMDVQMPEMNGLEATRLIRRRECGAHLPILALTAHAMTGDRERCLEAGMDGYLTKPVRVADLLREIARLGGIVPVRESETAPSREHQPG
jgi:two-component system sensor histidine kinase/response regulator